MYQKHKGKSHNRKPLDPATDPRPNAKGTYVHIYPTGETYETQEGRETHTWDLFAYTPSDNPKGVSYTSRDMALSVAGYEHGNVRTFESEQNHARAEREALRGY